MKEIVGQEIAVVSDIHGNSFALQEVLKDIKERGITTIINLGDSLYGPLDPKGTYELIVNNSIQSISGNQDRLIVENWDAKSDYITLEYVKSQLDENMLHWLQSLASDQSVNDEIYCCHASPHSDSVYLLEQLVADKVSTKNKEELDALLSHIKQGIVCCGHSHVSKIVRTAKKVIVNPGSVGLPAYDDELPIYHKMENHKPNSNYVVMKKSHDSLKLNRISVEYDFEEAASLAEQNHRDDWAKWIRTGTV
ncbi:metallophosphoesterase [Labilibaculum sp.]|uniref:metallophosphoesterase family protein n=1 Tax=Labilibaculum sp. TaxID=2060723 RepID=UPI003564F2E0